VRVKKKMTFGRQGYEQQFLINIIYIYRCTNNRGCGFVESWVKFVPDMAKLYTVDGNDRLKGSVFCGKRIGKVRY